MCDLLSYLFSRFLLASFFLKKILFEICLSNPAFVILLNYFSVFFQSMLKRLSWLKKMGLKIYFVLFCLVIVQCFIFSGGVFSCSPQLHETSYVDQGELLTWSQTLKNSIFLCFWSVATQNCINMASPWILNQTIHPFLLESIRIYYLFIRSVLIHLCFYTYYMK